MPVPETQSSTDNTVPAAPQAPQSTPSEGTSLWNLQTQKPEWIPLHLVKSRLASGAYKTYAGSAVPVVAGIGGEGQMSPEAASTAVAGGATPTHTEAFRDLEARDREFSQAYDNAGDKALAYLDGVTSGLSGGLLDGVPTTSKLGDIERKKRLEEHPNYEGLGELTALAATILAPESALKYTPLGASNKLFGATSKAVDAALTTRVGSSVLRRGISEAAGGAAASAALSSAHAVEQSVQGKPISGYAIIDDVGLGALIGGGIGIVGEKLSGAAKKITDARTQIEAAARFDESAAPVRGMLTDVSTSWHSAHNVAGARVEALEDLVKAGHLNGDMPGEDWLKARSDAKTAADTAKAKLSKLAGTDDPVAVAERLHDLAISGKAKDAEKLYKAFDEYGTAVSHLDDVMQPTTFDTAHLGDVIGDLDLAIPAKDHPLQRLEEMINNGSPPEEIERFAKEYDAAINRERGHAGPDDVTIDKPLSAEPKATSDGRAGRKKVVAEAEPSGQRVKTEAVDVTDPETGLKRKVEIPGGPGKLGEDINAPLGNEESAQQALLGRGGAGNEQAGFQAKKILDQARVERLTGVMSPTRPTELGNKIQSLIDQLTATTGGRLGSPEARALANKLGMNTAALNGPVSQKLADLWSLHRLSEHLAEQLGRRGTGTKKSILTKALSWGAVSGAGSVAYDAGGSFAAGATRSLVRHALGTALFGAAAVTAAAGRFRQSAVLGLAKALNPTVRRGAALTGIYKTVSSTYQPDTKPTTDYNTKAQQLRTLAENSEPIREHISKKLEGLRGVDPQAFTATVEAAVTRLQNLAAALPTVASYSYMTKTKRGPTPAQMHEWHMYEAATADRELVFKYLKAGYMPQAVVEAMNEQHPDYMNEVRDYVLNNQDEVQSAPHATQMALSKLLGVPLVPEANPAFVQRMQEPYIEAKQKATQAKAQNMGGSALHAAPATAAQILVLPH